LPGPVGSEKFMTVYRAALGAGAVAPEIGADRTKPGTINSLFVSYYKSAQWSGADTQRIRRPHIERFREKHGNKRVALLIWPHIEAMMAAIPNVYVRRHWSQAIKPLLQSVAPLRLRVNPAEGVKVKIAKTRGWHTWTDDEIGQYRASWPLGTQQRLVMEFALEAVSRRAEVVRLGPQHVRSGPIHIERVHGSKPVDIPVTDELQAACDAMPKGQPLYVVNSRGRPRSTERAWERVAKWANQAGLPTNCRLHGLKNGGMRRLAESGATGHELSRYLDHQTRRVRPKPP
jgi:hypothetical protein